MSFRNIYKGKKVLVTGDTGFKGSWLSIWLQELGADVYGYALDPVSADDNFVTSNLANYIKHETGDIRNLANLVTFFEDVQPDIAFHLAAQPLVLLSYSDPVNTFESNLMGVVNFFEAVRKTASVKVAVNVTSDKCYDNKEWVWGYRENDPMGGKDPYSASKGCAELITNSYISSFFNTDSSCSVASARAGNVIGGGDWAADRIIPDYFRSVKAGHKLMVRNPYATRPWQHVLEPLSGYLSLASKLFMEGKKYVGGWNFGPEDTANYSVKDLIDSILTEFPEGGYYTPQDLQRPHEANFLKLDISKAVNQLHWRPVLTFQETVKFTVDGYKADLNNSDILQNRKSQIRQYTEYAITRNIEWAI
ncbi:CDP-glucose 4,6-dehydratase [uncultured Mucilaginibacter sp.]|uniref:CDP-glucose 4,6-dehydratase n=1 Tax=uncultured Mucilaginibacter sp. TaxID=797541 RepID=UPI0025CB942E|nr:CDP-glucose 4,6-dehydratase [uncultured Mucilaginibacter sp.]